jgi:hypothetical protein
MRWLYVISASILMSLSATAQINQCIAGRYSESYYFDSSSIQVSPNVLYAVSKRWPATAHSILCGLMFLHLIRTG